MLHLHPCLLGNLLRARQNLLRSFVRIDAAGRLDKCLLILAQLRVPDFQEARQRHIDHFIVQKF